MLKIMNTLSHRIIIAACATTMFVISQGTQATDYQKFLYQGDTDYVKIVDQDERGIPNDHPFVISAKELVSVLSPLTYKKKAFLGLGSDNEPIFERQQLEKLSGYLSEGLKTASRRQDIIFVMTGRKGDLIGTKSLVTSGRVFITSNQLNIIFGHIDLDYEAYIDNIDHYMYIERKKAGEGTERYRELTTEVKKNYPIKPGYRKKEGTLGTVNISAGGQPVKTERNGWVAITLQARSAADIAEREQMRQADQKLEEIRARHEGKFREGARYEDYQSAPAPAPAPARPAYKETMTIDQRLSKLKELREKDLIDEATYQKKLEEIMSEL